MTNTNLGTEGQILFDANKKSKLVAYLLWLFPALFGIMGGHRLYMRQYTSGAIMLLGALAGAAIYFVKVWPTMAAQVEAITKAAESGQPIDPATLPQPDYSALLQDPVALVGIAIMIVLSLWWIVDAFLIPGMVRRHNETLLASLAGGR